ncbi:reprolysin-like metallopeptidase [Geodermatophilus maliterrae]|uniref:Reprolysin-like metallopeptidase n=1 Tax=Geodermatophilus maliterrae TaxID=3162531 RepID=A0ABV3XLT9_9ACTN
MPHAARPRPPRLLSLAAATAVLTPLLLAGPAAAESPAEGPAAGPAEEVTAGDTVVGELVQTWAEHEDPDEAAAHADDALLSWVTEDDGTSVRVDSDGVDDLPVGATVEVTVGAEVPEEPGTAEGVEPAREVLEAEVVAPAETVPAAPASAPYTNEVTVVLVAPSGLSPDATTVQQVVDQVNGPVADFWESQSGGAVRIHATAGADSWVTSSAVCTSSSALWTDVAGRISWTGGAGRHLLLYVPGYPSGMPSCAYGLASIGSSRGAGGSLYVRAVSTSVIAHELGHNFGLGHASAVQCDGSPEATPCRTVSYWDWYDVMGVSWNEVGSLNAPHAARLDLLPASARVAVDSAGTGGTYTLTPMGGGTGTRVLALTARDGRRYWVEYRTAVGQDGWLDPAIGYGFEAGVLVHTDGPGPTGDTSLLLDGTPAAQAQWAADEQTVLPAGNRMSLGGGSFTVSVVGASASGATVTVRTAADGPAADSPIAVLYRSLGGSGGSLGAPTGDELCGLRSGGCAQHFRNGSIYWSPATGARVVRDQLLAEFLRTGGPSGWLGYPVGDRYATPDSGWTQAFQGGRVHSSPATGAHAVPARLGAAYDPLRGESGVLGYPVTAPYPTAGGGQTQAFQHGRIHWSQATGAHAVYTQVSRAYDPMWGESGPLGYPVSGRYATANGGVTQAFQHGRIHWSPATGGHAVLGEISRVYDPLWGESGLLGYPVGGRYPTANGGVTQAFQHGRIHWSPATGGHAVTSVIGQAYDPLRGESGVLGYPVGGRYPTAGGGWTQPFQHGRIHWSPATGAHAVWGPIRAVYDPMWGESGVLGYPVTEPYPTVNGGTTQAFQHGRIHWSPATGGFAVQGAISRTYDARGGESGRLGYPTGPQRGSSRVEQTFQRGRISHDAATGTSVQYY